MEIWDVIDQDRRGTGRTVVRGETLAPGDFHLVVEVWLRTGNGQVLLTRRHPEKTWPLFWECTGGSALAGEDSLAAAVREVAEETGIRLEPSTGKLVHRYIEGSSHYDVWCFTRKTGLDEVVLQEGETVDARFADREELRHLHSQGTLVPKFIYALDHAIW